MSRAAQSIFMDEGWVVESGYEVGGRLGVDGQTTLKFIRVLTW
jgi:hypothetical protein